MHEKWRLGPYCAAGGKDPYYATLCQKSALPRPPAVRPQTAITPSLIKTRSEHLPPRWGAQATGVTNLVWKEGMAY
jgi:hypothetical protein